MPLRSYLPKVIMVTEKAAEFQVRGRVGSVILSLMTPQHLSIFVPFRRDGLIVSSTSRAVRKQDAAEFKRALVEANSHILRRLAGEYVRRADAYIAAIRQEQRMIVDETRAFREWQQQNGRA